MTPRGHVNYAVLFALHREAAPFLKSRSLPVAAGPPHCATFRSRNKKSDLTVLVTGIGFDRARQAIKWAIAELQPELVVAAGYAGALDPSLKVGDIFVASEIIESADQKWHAVIPAELGDSICGRLFTARAFIATAAEKRRLFRSARAMAVDMESAAIAEACQGERIPCAVVRAISDSAETDLSPRLADLLSAGRVSPFRALAAIARSPSLAVQFWRLARATRRAAGSLADALNQLIPS
jgi:adenosylhomocysteine nucleosidase